MNVLMVYPRFPDTSFWKFNHALHFVGKKASLPPMGLLTVAALLPRYWEVRLINLNYQSLRDDDLLWADLVFTSAMTIQKSSVRHIIDQCRRMNLPLVAGGPLFTSIPEEYADVDHLVLNEAEVTLPHFLRDLEDGHTKQVYTSDKWADISASPIPRWDLIELNRYASMCIQYSRGCPYDCSFCDITVLFGRRPRIKSVNGVLGELDALFQVGWRGNIFFVDDNFIGNKRHLKTALLPAIISWMKERKYPFRFQTQASVDLASDDELITLMVAAGFEAVFVGIETPDEESLAECSKMQNTRVDLLGSVGKLQSSGLQVQAGFIVGFDSDKESIFARMSRFINESGIVTSMVGLLNAPVGTKLYKRMVKENRIRHDPTGDNTDYSMNFIPKMDYTALVAGYKNIIRDIYSPDPYYRRLKVFLENYKCSTKYEFKRRFSPENFRAFFMSLYKLGIKPGIRRHFWKLMMWTALHRPRSIPIAIQLAIYSYQFKKYYNL